MKHGFAKFPKPAMDPEDSWLLVHSGDFSYYGQAAELKPFGHWLTKCPHHYKIIIAGNHERNCDPGWVQRCHDLAKHPLTPALHVPGLLAVKVIDIRKKFSNLKTVTYIDQESFEFDGLKFWGSPYSLKFFDWGFQLDPKDAKAHWAQIPMDTDIVLSHGPPKYQGDRCPDIYDPNRTVFVGDEELLERLRIVKPIACVFGHVHEGKGVYYDQGVTMVNASFLTGGYYPVGSYTRLHIENKKIIKIEEISIL